MAASFRLILTRFGLPDKPEAPIRIVDGRPTGPTPCPEPRHVRGIVVDMDRSGGKGFSIRRELALLRLHFFPTPRLGMGRKRQIGLYALMNLC